MSTRGIYNREGELFGYLEGTRTYDLDGNLTGEVRGHTVYDLNDERHWVIDGDALLDPHGNVLGYLGERVPHDQ